MLKEYFRGLEVKKLVSACQEHKVLVWKKFWRQKELNLGIRRTGLIFLYSKESLIVYNLVLVHNFWDFEAPYFALQKNLSLFKF